MKKTLAILRQTSFPIQVTTPQKKEDLEGWIAHFREKKIKIALKEKGGRFEIWRSVTKEEMQEIRDKMLIIRGCSFLEKERVNQRIRFI